MQQVFADVRPCDGLFQRLWEHFARASAWQPYVEVLPALAKLRRDGYQLVLASNFDDRLTEIASAHPMFEHFDWLFHATRLKCAKPDAAFYHHITASLNVPAGSILMVGDDRECDYEAPQRVGWHATLLDRSGTTKQPIKVIQSLSELGSMTDA